MRVCLRGDEGLVTRQTRVSHRGAGGIHWPIGGEWSAGSGGGGGVSYRAAESSSTTAVGVCTVVMKQRWALGGSDASSDLAASQTDLDAPKRRLHDDDTYSTTATMKRRRFKPQAVLQT